MGEFYRTYQWRGQELWLKYNFDAMKILNQKFPDEDFVREIAQHYADRPELVCVVAAELIRQGETLRLHFGYPPRRYPDALELQMISSPDEFLALVAAVLDELVRLNADDISEPLWEDPWLAEAEKKKELPSLPEWVSIGRLLGLRPYEAVYMFHPADIGRMLEILKERHRPKGQ